MKSTPLTAAKAYIDLFSDVESEITTEFLPEENEETIALHLRFAEKLFPEKGLALCPISHAGFSYYSSTCEHVLGRTCRELSGMSIADFFGLLHPDDLPSVKRCFEFMGSLKPFDPEKYRFTIHYRIQNKLGDYQYVVNENIAIHASGSRYLFLMLFTNLTQSEKFFQVKMDVSKEINGIYTTINSFHPEQAEKDITPRQNDITQLIVRGFSNLEIANKLGVSIFTVKNHKRILFKKFKVKNSVQFANYAAQNGRGQ
jgi:DNA-binding CsgD family transcriptional regulator